MIVYKLWNKETQSYYSKSNDKWSQTWFDTIKTLEIFKSVLSKNADYNPDNLEIHSYLITEEQVQYDKS